MKVDLFDFDLPSERVALEPMSPRDHARLLVVEPEGVSQHPKLSHHHVYDLPTFLKPNDVLIINNTRVIPGRLIGKRGAGKVEITLHKRLSKNSWRAFAKPAKKCTLGTVLNFDGLTATVTAVGEGGERTIAFDLGQSGMLDALATHGEMPLPPYIATKRAVNDDDKDSYQTIYAKKDGAVAAPTAGLHFTNALIDAITAKGIKIMEVTLHVGAGTFLPVVVEDTTGHRMHREWGSVSRDVAAKINAARRHGGRVIAVGTTSLRLLESASDADGTIHPFAGDTDIFITPGYVFKAVDMLMTNFHIPRSTLFMLVSAFSGLKAMRRAYQTAIQENYRFYSYGDATLLSIKKDKSPS